MHKITIKIPLSRLLNRRAGLLFGAALLHAGCSPALEPAPPAADVQSDPKLLCGPGGHLQTEIHGAISARLEWNREQLECSGMRRPEAQGARLRFAGNVGNSAQRISVIVAIPELTRDAIGDEYASNVTIIEEGTGRFFSTASIENCLTDITALDALDDSGDRFAIGGVLYCLSPIAEVNGTSSVSLGDLHFSGLLDWSAT